MTACHLRTGCALLLLALCVAVPSAARAQFADCNDPGYLQKFEARLGPDAGFLCVESARVPVATVSGTSHIRIIQHLVADWATRPGAMRAIKDGVARSAAAIPKLGGIELSNVTILLVDGFGPGDDAAKALRKKVETFGDIAAVTNINPGDECRITMWLLGPGASASYGSSVVSHELFHCVQRSNLSAAQLASSTAADTGGAWWMEGSADWFTTVTGPAPRFLRDRVDAFDRGSPRVALNRMSYEAYVFFAWLGGARRPAAVLPFLRAMASSASESAQRTAMVAALPADQWLRFAQDYLDRAIRDGQGASIGSTPLDGDPLAWDRTQTHRIDLAPFVLQRARLTFRCGRWRVEPRPARLHAVKPGGGTTWGAFPATLDAMDGQPREFRFAGMAASASAVALQVTGTLEATCQECAATREVDQCLVGTWEMTQDGMREWMRVHLPNVQVAGTSKVGNTLTLAGDRSFRTGASRVRVSGVHVDSEPSIRATSRLAGQVSGRWSAAGGQLNICPDAGAVAGSVTTVVHGKPITVPMQVDVLQPYSQAYACSGSSLRVTTPMAGAGTVTSVYTKVATPP